MADNSDNKLREKLMGLEPAFDPAAWDKMEAMLDKKKKRRFIIWWWTGGIAAALLLGFGAFEYNQHTTTGKQLSYNTTTESTVPGNTSTINSNSELNTTGSKQPLANNTVNNNSNKQPQATEVAANNNGNQIAATNNTTSKHNAASGSGFTKPAQRNIVTNETVNAEAKNNSSHATKHNSAQTDNHTGTVASLNSHPTNNTLAASAVPVKHKASAKHHVAGKTGSAGAADETNSAGVAAETIATANTTPAANAVTNSSITETVYLQRMEAGLLQAGEVQNEIAAPDFKEEENILPKTRKKIFSYSLGVAAHVSGATVGTEGGSANHLFYKSPTWLVGFTHDFTFVNRVAITNGVMYGQTAFEVKQPKTVNYPVSPVNYNSHISEIAIPIGIKVYPVVKQNFRFYISTGIINHIKLKETFNYTVQDTPVYNSLTNDPMGMYPETNDFTGDVKTVGSLASTNLSVSTTNDFAVSAKRYYASYYAGAGFEYIARNHFTLFAEPVFYMGLNKIGVQDKRKYNVGVTAGFRYRF